MSLELTIDAEKRIIYLTGRSNLTRAMLQEIARVMVTDDAFDPTFDICADFSRLAFLDLDVADIRWLVEKNLAKARLTGRLAIVTGHDQGRYSLGVFFQALSEGFTHTRQGVFRTSQEAHAWLNQIPQPAPASP